MTSPYIACLLPARLHQVRTQRLLPHATVPVTRNVDIAARFPLSLNAIPPCGFTQTRLNGAILTLPSFVALSKRRSALRLHSITTHKLGAVDSLLALPVGPLFSCLCDNMPVDYLPSSACRFLSLLTRLARTPGLFT